MHKERHGQDFNKMVEIFNIHTRFIFRFWANADRFIFWAHKWGWGVVKINHSCIHMVAAWIHPDLKFTSFFFLQINLASVQFKAFSKKFEMLEPFNALFYPNATKKLKRGHTGVRIWSKDPDVILGYGSRCNSVERIQMLFWVKDSDVILG